MITDCPKKSVYTIPSSQSFERFFVQYVMNYAASSGVELTSMHLLLPSRRACRIMRSAFLRYNDGKAMLLPNMSPIGEVDSEDLSLITFSNTAGFLDIPEAIAPMQRQLMMAKLIRSLPDFVQGAEHALSLAQHLCQFIDQVLVEELSFEDMGKIVPEEFSEHWQITLDFLKIIVQHWPNILAENNLIESAQRRIILLDSLSQHWQHSPPDYPVIAAGVTGSIPAVRRLLKVVSDLPYGHIILPGLDQIMDDDAWNAIEETHPQYALKQTLQHVGCTRQDVSVFNEGMHMARESLASAMMLPAVSTYQWQSFFDHNDIDACLSGLQYYACANEQEEAALIALLMRESLEVPGQVCALVTPDRKLAKRVRAACGRYGIEVDDSAGQSLYETNLGAFFILLLQACHEGYDSVALLSFLKSPIARAGYSKSEFRGFVNQLECDVLRQEHVFRSYDDLVAHIEVPQLLEFYDCVADVIKPLYGYARGSHAFSELLKVHLHAAELFAGRDDLSGQEVLWRGTVGEAGSSFFADLFQYAHFIGDVTLREYEEILSSLMRGATVRLAYGVHPRLLILGQLEARLSHADRVIIGGLNEGVWPADSGHEPWMSRPMRKRFGLPGPEQAVGLSAHDFVQNFCAQDVILTRSEKVDRAPSVPSRWLSRLNTVLRSGGRTLNDLTQPQYLQWVEQLDYCETYEPYARPAPKPPVCVRPRGVSVTKVETWLSDPYSIYMYYVLNLRPLKPLVPPQDSALRGIVLHEAFDRFVADNPAAIPADAETVLNDIVRDVLFERLADPRDVEAWWPKFSAIISWFVKHEEAWRERARFLTSEVKGSLTLDIDGAPFKLYGRADRIDRINQGYAIIDYKSGGQFSKSKLKNVDMPQLPLEALIAANGGYEGLAAGDVSYLGYWKASGGRDVGEVTAVDEDIGNVIQAIEARLSELVRVFRDQDTPFYCIPDLSRVPRFHDYAHVARVKEWIIQSQGEA